MGNTLQEGGAQKKDQKDLFDFGKEKTLWIPQTQRAPAIESKITESIRAVLYQNNNTRKRFIHCILVVQL